MKLISNIKTLITNPKFRVMAMLVAIHIIISYFWFQVDKIFTWHFYIMILNAVIAGLVYFKMKR